MRLKQKILAGLTRAYLAELAAGAKVAGYARLKKDDLVSRLSKKHPVTIENVLNGLSLADLKPCAVILASMTPADVRPTLSRGLPARKSRKWTKTDHWRLFTATGLKVSELTVVKSLPSVASSKFSAGIIEHFPAQSSPSLHLDIGHK